MPVTWVACRMVPSTPARMLYRCFQCWLSCSARAAATASWISRGRRNSWRQVRDVVPWPGRPGRRRWRTGPRSPAFPLLDLAPACAGGVLGAGHLLVVPVDGEHLGGVSAGAGLRRAGGQQRAGQGGGAGGGVFV